MLLRLSRDIRQRGCAVAELVSMSLDSLAYREMIPPILAAPGMTTARCDRLLAALREHEAGPDLVLGMLQGEYVMLRSALRPEIETLLRKLAADPESVRMFGGAVTNKDLADLADYAAKMTPADIQNQTNAINTWYRSLEKLSHAPRQQRDRAVPRIIDETVWSKSGNIRKRVPLLSLFMPPVESLFGAVDRDRCFTAGPSA